VTITNYLTADEAQLLLDKEYVFRFIKHPTDTDVAVNDYENKTGRRVRTQAYEEGDGWFSVKWLSDDENDDGCDYAYFEELICEVPM
jgi:hypothetical protein